MIKVFLLLITLGATPTLFAQKLSNIENNVLVYEAYFIQSNGDTLTRECIHFQFMDDSWSFQPNVQKELRISYFTDTVGISDFEHPFEKRRKKHERFEKKKLKQKKGWENWTWLFETQETGYELNDSTFWIHPPRSNQYLYNEIAGMPQIALNRLFSGGKWKSKLIIMMGWHEFKGTLESTYMVSGNTNYQKGSIHVADAWLIAVSHKHSELGSYGSTIVFDENKFGFLTFDNTFHDGNRIVLNLVEIRTPAKP